MLQERGDCPGRASPEDATLLARARRGDSAAFAWLYERYIGVALTHARSYSADDRAARDLVTECFVRLLGGLRRGRGPATALPSYLAATMRVAAYERCRGRPCEVRACDLVPLDTSGLGLSPCPDGELVWRAFWSLPPRWQIVLWRIDVEGEPAAAMAMDLGLSPRATAALVRRARAGLRGAYLREHLRAEHLAPWWRAARRCIVRVRGRLGLPRVRPAQGNAAWAGAASLGVACVIAAGSMAVVTMAAGSAMGGARQSATARVPASVSPAVTPASNGARRSGRPAHTGQEWQRRAANPGARRAPGSNGAHGQTAKSSARGPKADVAGNGVAGNGVADKNAAENAAEKRNGKAAKPEK